jgi:hypothetical protein
MGTHYKVLIFDDHLGFIKDKTPHQQAEELNFKLEQANANIFIPVKYVEGVDCLFFELRKDHPKKYLEFFNFDNVYYSEDCAGSHLITLKKTY